MNAFAAAIDALFADPNLAVDALYRADGADPSIPVMVIVRRPDRIGDFGETRILAEQLSSTSALQISTRRRQATRSRWTTPSMSSRASHAETANG
jgi:hypothetical protein